MSKHVGLQPYCQPLTKKHEAITIHPHTFFFLAACMLISMKLADGLTCMRSCDISPTFAARNTMLAPHTSKCTGSPLNSSLYAQYSQCSCAAHQARLQTTKDLGSGHFRWGRTTGSSDSHHTKYCAVHTCTSPHQHTKQRANMRG